MSFFDAYCLRSRVVITLALLTLPCMSQARETLTWLLSDLPPSTIFSGPMRGQGAMDQLMPTLTARMPEYDHVLMRVNRARGMQMLSEGASLYCDPTLLWTPERAKTIAFSVPVFVMPSSGLIMRKEDLPKVEPFIIDGKVDFAALMSSKAIRLGVVAERSYGEVIDKILQNANPSEVSLHYGSDAMGSLLQMARAGRLQGMLGYWFEVRYQAIQQGINPQELTLVPVLGNPVYQSAYMGCSGTPAGIRAMDVINREMRGLRESALLGFYAQWLEPEDRPRYVMDVKAIFAGSSAP